MPEYLLLVAASANRVYSSEAPRLMLAELRVFAEALVPASDRHAVRVEETALGGVGYVSLRAPELTENQLSALANLSGLHALYRRHGDLLEPLPVRRLDRLPSDLVTIPKYQGKTNEQLTKLLLNVTALSTAQPERLFDGSLRVLDPLCGRGTTLNQAALYGLDATGVDLDRRDVDAYTTFLITWLKTHRFKHRAETGALRVAGRTLGRRLEVEFAPDKDDYRAGRVQRLRVFCTDTTGLDGLLKARSFDVLVADTPYGVQHGSHGDRLARSPLGLLEAALPGWVRLLREGGAVGLAFNRHVAPRPAVVRVLADNGLVVRDDIDAEAFVHRVDRSIERDVVIARKP